MPLPEANHHGYRIRNVRGRLKIFARRLDIRDFLSYAWHMPTLQEQYDDAMFDFSAGEYDAAIAKLRAVLVTEPSHFDSQLALGMAYYRKGEYATAIAEGKKAEKMKPGEQLVHTNLSLFYMKAGDKGLAEHHGLQARISSWRQDAKAPAANAENPDLQLAKPEAPPPLRAVKPPEEFPDMPWKKKKVDS